MAIQEQEGVELDPGTLEVLRILRDTHLGGPAQGSTAAEIRERQTRYAYEMCPLAGHHIVTIDEIVHGLVRENESHNYPVVNQRLHSNGLKTVRRSYPADPVLDYFARSRGKGVRRIGDNE